MRRDEGAGGATFRVSDCPACTGFPAFSVYCLLTTMEAGDCVWSLLFFVTSFLNSSAFLFPPGWALRVDPSLP